MEKTEISQLIYDQFCDSHNVRPYSGRGMMGRVCLGVTVTQPLMFMYELGRFCVSEEVDLLDYTCVRQDNMGHDYIVYFPELPWLKLEGEEEEC